MNYAVCPRCGKQDCPRRAHESAYCARCFGSFRVPPAQLDIAGNVSTGATGAQPEPRHEQDRLFTPTQPTIPGSMSLDIP